jgi:choline dehydrogenase-like flavoprotein
LSEDFDYIIVGAGSAGCLLANRLTADGTARVLLLEAGGDDDWIWYHIPVGYFYTNNNPRSDWCFRTAPEPALGGRALPYPRGKVIGGSSAINAMIYIRGQAADYDHWRQLGLAGWGWDDVLPLFKKHEDFFGGADDVHGAGGELRVDPPRVGWPVLDVVKEAAIEAGIRPVDDFNRGDNEGVGPLHVNQRRGVRFQSAKAFLRPAMRRSNLRVETRALVERIVLRDRRAIGVSYRHNGVARMATVRRDVILAAGAIGSPHILMLSGIGPAAHLKQHGISITHELPGVGENLHDHLQIPIRYRLKGVRTLNEWFHSPFRRVLMGLDYALRGRGPLTMAPSQLGIFTRSSPDAAHADIGYNVIPYTRSSTSTTTLDREPGLTLSVYDCRPTSRGDIRLTSPDPAAAPAIRLNYLATERDRRVAADSMRVTRRLMRQPSIQPYAPREFSPGDTGEDSDEVLLAQAARVANTIFHPVGSCRMGLATDAAAVVDARLRLHGLDGLVVADASIMPAITSGNTNAPTMMIAEKAAALLLS